MKTPAAAPYLLPPDSVVIAQAWTNEDGIEVGERLDHWDPYTDLELVRVMEIDVDSIRTACLLGDDAAFALTATWTSSTTTRLAGHGPVVELGSNGGLLRAALAVLAPGASVGGRLNLHTRLVLRYPGREPSPISPRRLGATLWTKEDRIVLEGGASRFPIAVADFSGSPRYPDAAAWVLEWDSNDLDAPVLGGMRPLVNGSHETLLQTLRTGTSDARATAVRSFVIFDAARSLGQRRAAERTIRGRSRGVSGRLRRQDALRTASSMLAGRPRGRLARSQHGRPSPFRRQLQAHFGVLV